MSCRFARVTEGVTVCELLTRGGWEQLAAQEQLRRVGIGVPDDSELCPVSLRGQWSRCPCRRVAQPPQALPVRL